jgi:hypothetical protein
MIRFFYAAAAALLFSVCIEQALAVSLSPSFADAASAPRYQSHAAANVNSPPVPAKSVNSSERCKEGANAISAAVASPDRHVEPIMPTSSESALFRQARHDKRRELEQEYYDCKS